MSEGEAEKKKIADLYFNVDTSNLDTINTKLKEIAQTSETYADKISKSLNKAFNNGNIIDTKAMSNNLSKIEKDSQQTNNSILKNNNSTANKIKVIEAETASYKEKMEAKKQYAVEKANAEQLKSTKTLYDQINSYAKTYLIYEGFNALKNVTKDLINEMVEVEYQMVSIDRVLNDSSLNINNYRDQLIQLAYDYGNSFDNVADVTLRLAQAGFDAQESLQLTEKTLLALNTAELNATQATDDMVAIMAQWGVTSGTAAEKSAFYGETIDKINKVADNFPTTSADILDALKKTSSAFNLAGASIDETIAMITTAEIASQRGGKAIGTAMSNIIQQLKDAGRLSNMEELGIEVYTDETKQEFNDVIDIITQLSEKMQKLKDAGKENSVEMQSLLEVFTVFRRNIGAGLLSGVAGEESTYNEVLKASLNSLGYSLEENEKHLKTAKAAQAQFNAELLKLKTEVWDAGGEEVFRSILEMGTNLVTGIKDLISNIGLLPTAIGTVTLAFSMLNKSTQAGTFIDAIPRIKQLNELYKETKGQIEGNTDAQKKYNMIMQGADTEFKSYVKSVDKGKVGIVGYTKSLITSTIKTALLTAGTIALQAAISGGLTLAITFLVTQIDNWINASEKAREKALENMEAAQENANAINEEISSVQELRKEYEELAKKEKRTPEEDQRIYEIQEELNQLIKDSGEQVELVTTKIDDQGKAVQKINDKYDEQLEKIKAVEYQKKQEEVEELRKAAESAREAMTPITNLEDNWWGQMWASNANELQAALKKAGVNVDEFVNKILDSKPFEELNWSAGLTDFGNAFQNLDFEQQLSTLKEWQATLKQAEGRGEDVSKALEIVETNLEKLEERYGTAKDAIDKYNDALGELYNMSGQVSQYNTFLESIAESYSELEGPNKLIDDIQELNMKFEDGKINVEDYFDSLQEKIDSIDFSKSGEELEAYQAIFSATTSYIAEGIESLYSGFASNEIDFTSFTEGIEGAADATLDLYTMQNELTQNAEGQWVDANNQLNEYANTLQSAKDELSSYGEILGVIGDNYDYIAQNANAAGEAAFTEASMSSQAYQQLATDLTNTFNTLRDNNQAAFNSITQNIADNIGISTNEMMDANGYLNQGFLNNFSNMNSALNTVANMSAQATQKVTVSLGNVMSSLGEAISNFSYTLKATPFISGNFGLHTDEKGIPNGISLPTFGFDITGEGGDSVKNLGSSLKSFGADLSNLGNINYGYYQLKQQAPYKSPTTTSPTTTSPTTTSPSGGGGSSGGSSSSSSDDAAKKEEEAYNNRLDAFKDYVSDMEEEEQRWVKKQQELEQLSAEDMQYITQQRIKRYENYLAQVKKMTWLNKEDRLELEKEYTQEIEDLKLDYIGYLKEALDEEIKAIEDANDKKIEAIEEEADKKIEALQKVEDENDRIRKKEEYEENRKKHLEDISYWEQRTGREAQEALKEAKENLKELDEEWEDQLEDWSIEDQIKAIEEQRDKQIAAIEEAEAKEIEALQKIYDEKVKLFSETGKIIYDNSVIQSKNLYNAYKKNFVDPLSKELSKLNVKTSSSSNKKEYESYKVKSGDTLSEIAAKFGTTVSKIMSANPNIKNKNLIYAGSTIKIPKFHEGGIVGGNKEAFALLKPNEVILRPEWADGINRLAKMAKQSTTNNNIINQGTTIEVKGDLVKVEASVKNKSDIDLLTRKLERMLTDKFNIKK